ncbi:MAG: MFS transporter [Bilophila wadsworthia]
MSPHSSKAMTRHAWFIFSILTICYALVSFFRTSTSTLAVDIIREFAVGGGLMSVMSSAYFYPYGFMQIPAGILSDRWGSRNTIASVLLIGAAGSLLFALSGSVTAATAGRVLIGVGMGMVFVPALRVILYWFPPARHASARVILSSARAVCSSPPIRSCCLAGRGLARQYVRGYGGDRACGRRHMAVGTQPPRRAGTPRHGFPSLPANTRPALA